MASSSSEVGQRITLIDLIRTASIGVVLMLHFWDAGVGRLSSPALDAAFRTFSRSGTYGVTMFFVLSGFLITRIIDRSEPDFFKISYERFYVRRLGRIFPLVAAAVLLGCLVLAATAGERSRAIDFIWRNPRGRMDLGFWLSIPTMTFNWHRILSRSDAGLHWDVMWSLAVEEQFYLFYPLVIQRMGNHARFRRLLLAFVALGPFARAIAWLLRGQYGVNAIIFNSFGAFDLIAIGALTYFALKAHGARLRARPRLAALLVAGGTVLGALVYALASPLGGHYIWGATAMGLSTAAVLVGGLSTDFFEKGVFRALAFPGKLSFGLYLLHGAILAALWRPLEALPRLLGFAVFVSAALLACEIAFRYFETPANDLVRAHFRRLRRPAVARAPLVASAVVVNGGLDQSPAPASRGTGGAP